MGALILSFIGAVIRWVYGTVWRTVANKKKYKFLEYLYGPEDSDDWFDETGHDFVNRVVALIVIVATIWLTTI